jgi:uncharacterized protein (TIGR02271 family)
MPKQPKLQADKVIPVIEERLGVDKRLVETGRGLRVDKTVEQHEELVDLSLVKDELVVKRVPCDILLDEGQSVATREVGNTLIVPVLEEVLVVQKRIRLREEIHITRHRRETHAPQSVTVRTERVEVKRLDDKSSS